MNYEQSIEETITRKQAMREISAHSASWEHFLRDEGDEETYLGKTVLDWLGY